MAAIDTLKQSVQSINTKITKFKTDSDKVINEANISANAILEAIPTIEG